MSPPPTWNAKKPSSHRMKRITAMVQIIIRPSGWRCDWTASRYEATVVPRRTLPGDGRREQVLLPRSGPVSHLTGDDGRELGNRVLAGGAVEDVQYALPAR